MKAVAHMHKAKKLLIVAGEASGDTHGAALVRELVKQEPGLRVAGLGGPRMAAAGVGLFQDLTSHAVIGAAGLFGSLGGLVRAYRRITHSLGTDRPDAIVLIDFPEFNLMVARHANEIGVPVIYYVSPQIWAWRTGRMKKIATRVRKMLVFFPFEKEMYDRAGVDATFVGHPLLDTMSDKLAVTDRAAVRRSLGLPESGTVVGLLPGSRRKEIEHVFPILLRSAEMIRAERPDTAFAVAQAERLPTRPFERVAARHDVEFKLIRGRAHDVMLASDLLLVCSGTATLEAGLLATPMIVTYNSDFFSYVLFGPFINPGDFALPNIVAGERIVPELYLSNAKPRRIAATALDLMDGKLDGIRTQLGVIRKKLGGPGASARAAGEILKII